VRQYCRSQKIIDQNVGYNAPRMIIKTIENVDAVYTGMLETTDRTLHVITSCN